MPIYSLGLTTFHRYLQKVEEHITHGFTIHLTKNGVAIYELKKLPGAVQNSTKNNTTTVEQPSRPFLTLEEFKKQAEDFGDTFDDEKKLKAEYAKAKKTWEADHA